MNMLRRLAIPTTLLMFASLVQAEPCQSGLTPGQRPGPYAFLVATGPNRGKSHCFVCETADRPAVIVFARNQSDSLAKLLLRVDQALQDHQKAELRAWATFLSDNQPAAEPKLTEWARKTGLRSLAVGIFEDQDGPPSYRLNREADVTVLLSVKQKVVANFAFRQGELNDDKIKDIVATLPKMVEGK
jgi:hypothetical protein